MNTLGRAWDGNATFSHPGLDPDIRRHKNEHSEPHQSTKDAWYKKCQRRSHRTRIAAAPTLSSTCKQTEGQYRGGGIVSQPYHEPTDHPCAVSLSYTHVHHCTVEGESTASHGYTHWPTLLQRWQGKRASRRRWGRRRWWRRREEAARAGLAKPAPRTRTFTFATLPQFSDGTTPLPAREDSSHFTVYITVIDQWARERIVHLCTCAQLL